MLLSSLCKKSALLSAAASSSVMMMMDTTTVMAATSPSDVAETFLGQDSSLVSLTVGLEYGYWKYHLYWNPFLWRKENGVPEWLRNDRDMVLHVIWSCMAFVKKTFHCPEDPHLTPVYDFEPDNSIWRILRNSSDAIRADREVVLKAMELDVREYTDVDISLQEDRQIALAALTPSNFDLWWEKFEEKSFSPFNKVAKIIMSRRRRDRGAIYRKLPESLRSDRYVAVVALQIRTGGTPFEVTRDSVESWKEDKRVVMAAVEKNYEALEYADESLRNDRNFCRELVKINWDVVRNFWRDAKTSVLQEAEDNPGMEDRDQKFWAAFTDRIPSVPLQVFVDWTTYDSRRPGSTTVSLCFKSLGGKTKFSTQNFDPESSIRQLLQHLCAKMGFDRPQNYPLTFETVKAVMEKANEMRWFERRVDSFGVIDDTHFGCWCPFDLVLGGEESFEKLTTKENFDKTLISFRGGGESSQ